MSSHPKHRDSNDGHDNVGNDVDLDHAIKESPDFIAAQIDALSRFEATRRNHAKRRLEDLETAAIASAMQQSEQDWAASPVAQSLQLAKRLKKQEAESCDKNFASALFESEQIEVARTLTVATLEHKDAIASERHHGSWDCSTCTFTNPPYRKRCQMCEGKAPADLLTFQELPDLRFGVEIEIVIPDGRTIGYTHQKVAEQLTELSALDVHYLGYTHQVDRDLWKIVPDSSILGSNSKSDLCLELVSPILKGEEGLDQMRLMLENVRKLGICTNRTCGFHVHVDASRGNDQAVVEMGTVRGIIRVARCFVALENAFDLLVGRSWAKASPHAAHRQTDSNKYCGSNRLGFGYQSNRQRWETIGSAQSYGELARTVNPNGRYHKLNVSNLANPKRQSTIEFRHHGGVEELLHAECWVRLILSFCEKTSRRVPASYSCLLRERSDPRTELEALFNLVDCKGLEQFFAMDRRLFENQVLVNDWKCATCLKTFANSRSLAQHTSAKGHALRLRPNKSKTDDASYK